MVSLHTDMSCVSVTQSVVIRASIVFVTQLFSARLQCHRSPWILGGAGWAGEVNPRRLLLLQAVSVSVSTQVGLVSIHTNPC